MPRTLASKRATHAHLETRLARIERQQQKILAAAAATKAQPARRHGCLLAIGLLLILTGLVTSDDGSIKVPLFLVGAALLAIVLVPPLMRRAERSEHIAGFEQEYEGLERQAQDLRGHIVGLEAEIDQDLHGEE